MQNSKVGVGPMFTFYIVPKMHKNLLSPPNHLYHHSFQIQAGPDFLAAPFLGGPVGLPGPQSCYFLVRGFAATWLPPLTGICWPGFSGVLHAQAETRSLENQAAPHEYLVPPPPRRPPWPEQISYKRKPSFQSFLSTFVGQH